ncbi:MAG: hypothetical protein JW955_20855 [Sedimentisphaerales bacterium]|nr:hypothetical protein [Sedimentisphaerales bacterium]
MRTTSYVWIACAGLLGVSLCCADSPAQSTSRKLVQLKATDADSYQGVMDLSMYAGEVLEKSVLEEAATPTAGNRVGKLGHWRGTPFVMTATVSAGVLHVRNESDFFVIWLRRNAAVPMDDSALGTVSNATKGLLADAYRPAPLDKVCPVDSVAGEGHEIRLLSKSEATEETATATCSYTNVSAKTRRWNCISVVHVLVKGRDLIIACEKAKARQMGIPQRYEGLLAAKVRLSESEAKLVADQPVLAGNVVFSEGADVTAVSSAVLNGCIWQTAGQATEDVCSAELLQPEDKPASTPAAPSDQQP